MLGIHDASPHLSELWILQGENDHRNRIVGYREMPSTKIIDDDFSSVAFMFPGQGSQYIGMAADLAQGSETTRGILRRADACLDYPLSKIMDGDPPGALDQTFHTQPAIFVHSVAMLEEFRSRCEAKPLIAAGHSLGEYTALYSAGSLDFEDALRIVQERAIQMEEAQPRATCGMAAIMGVARDRLEGLVQENRGVDILEIANFNAPDQIVISGHLSALHRAMDAIKGEKRARAVLLNVSSAFHTPLMRPAMARLAEIIQSARMRPLSVPVLANVDAKPYPSNPESMKEKLLMQLVNPVRWEDCVNEMAAQGATTFIEFGPGKVLTGLLRRIDKRLTGINISSVSSCQEYVAGLQ